MDEHPEDGKAGKLLITRRRVLWGGAGVLGGLLSGTAAFLWSRFGPSSRHASLGFSGLALPKSDSHRLVGAETDPYACARITASRTAASAGNVFETGEYPFGPRTHDLGWVYMFDMAVIGTILACRPGDRVLDVGAGSGASTEVLVRFGYEAVALDPDHLALTQALRRLHLDRRLRPDHGSAVGGIAERLPFRDQSFDGILGMNVLHHVDDLEAAVREFARVLKPGRRAAFCEVGTRHVEFAATRNVMRETHSDEQAFDVREVGAIALANGFNRVELRPFVYPTDNRVELRELDTFAKGQHPLTWNRPEGMARFMIEKRPLFVLQRNGSRPLDSRFPARLECSIEVGVMPRAVRPGERLSIAILARNRGDTKWLSEPYEYGGYVTFGSKLLHPDGRIVTDALGRTQIPHDVPPGGSVACVMKIPIPLDLPPGDYLLSFDMVDEHVRWFSHDAAEPLPTYPLRVRLS